MPHKHPPEVKIKVSNVEVWNCDHAVSFKNLNYLNTKTILKTDDGKRHLKILMNMKDEDQVSHDQQKE